MRIERDKKDPFERFWKMKVTQIYLSGKHSNQ